MPVRLPTSADCGRERAGRNTESGMWTKGDPLLKEDEESEDSAYGGSGIVELKQEGDLLVAHRDIILGKNVPGYE